MNKTARLSAAAAMAMVLTFSTACTGQGNKSGQSQAASPSPEASAQAQSQGQGGNSSASSGGGLTILQTGIDGSVPIRKVGNDDYVQATKLLEVIGFRNVWDSNQKVLKFGDFDAAYEVRMDSTKARKEEDTLTLSKAPLLVDGIPHIPVAAIPDLLSDVVSYTRQGEQLVFHAAPDYVSLQVDEDGPMPMGDALDFADDPNDPYKNLAGGEKPAAVDQDGAVAAAALPNIDIPSLVSRAKTYLGVKYVFGASPYPQSGAFDCSSYTQYLFAKHGITLPRTARAQARLGTTVSRKNLRIGDLLYFSVPGRFQSNKTVGHVGIYIGNNIMINASPLPKDGVQYININKAYWKSVFLFAKRIAY